MKSYYAVLTLIGLLLLTGCWTSRWPSGMSIDRHNFVSTPSMPLTVVLRDTITHEELLRIDVPVRKELVLDLEHMYDNTAALSNAIPAEKVAWEIIDPGDWWAGSLENTMELPGNDVMIVVEVRDKETSPDPAAVPAYTPMQSQQSQGPVYTPSGPAIRTQTPTPRAQPQPAAAPAPAEQAAPWAPAQPQAAPAPQSQPQAATAAPYTPPAAAPGGAGGHELGASDARPRPARPASPPQTQPEESAPAETQPESQPEESAPPTETESGATEESAPAESQPESGATEETPPPTESESDAAESTPPAESEDDSADEGEPSEDETDEDESGTYEPEYTPSGDEEEKPPADLEDALE